MFDANHYVPILRWKGAERVALRELRAEDRVRITPLIEIPRKIFDARKSSADNGADPDQVLFRGVGDTPDPEQVLFKAAKSVLEAWRYASFFLDLCHIDGRIPQLQSAKHPLIYIAAESRK